MPNAGQIIRAGQVPGELIGDLLVTTADSANFTTTETQIQTIIVPVVSGRSYKVSWHPHWASSVNNDEVRMFIREDSTSGTVLNSGYALASSTGGNLGRTALLVAKFTAASTTSKTFSLSASRVAGTGNCRLDAASDRPSLAWVEYWYG